MITLKNGYSFEYRAASGALGFDGRGWWWERMMLKLGLIKLAGLTPVMKTITRHPRRGNLLLWQSRSAQLQIYRPWHCIRTISDGVVNAVGLTNPGLDWWCKYVKPTLPRNSIIGSIYGENIQELEFLAASLESAGFVALELNASCPNTGCDILKNSDFVLKSCEAVWRVTHYPLIVKLSVAHDIETIVPQLKDWVAAIAINSVPWSVVFPHVLSPLTHLGGGAVSGGKAQAYTWAFARRLVQMTRIPIIGCSVWNEADMEKLWEIGVSAIDFGSIFLRYPWRPGHFIAQDRRRRMLQS